MTPHVPTPVSHRRSAERFKRLFVEVPLSSAERLPVSEPHVRMTEAMLRNARLAELLFVRRPHDADSDCGI